MAFFVTMKGAEEMSEEIINRELGEGSGDEVGTLYLVATPLGNREDMSPRAARILEQVAYVAAEDTRTAARLLSSSVGNRLISYYEQNQHARHEMFLRDLHAGRSIAVISEAGMPCISDPGEGIVRLAVENGIPISVIPGPSAFVSAVAASGFDTRRFVYEGFIPARGRERRMLIKEIASERRTIVFYEAPHRIEKTFRDFVEAMVLVVSSSHVIDERYEEFIRLTVAEAVACYETVTPRGIYIVLEALLNTRRGQIDARSDEELIEFENSRGMTTREEQRMSLRRRVNQNNYQLALSVKEMLTAFRWCVAAIYEDAAVW